MVYLDSQRMHSALQSRLGGPVLSTRTPRRLLQANATPGRRTTSDAEPRGGREGPSPTQGTRSSRRPPPLRGPPRPRDDSPSHRGYPDGDYDDGDDDHERSGPAGPNSRPGPRPAASPSAGRTAPSGLEDRRGRPARGPPPSAEREPRLGPRQGGPQFNSRSERLPASQPQDPFDALHSRLQEQVLAGTVVGRESWEKLLGHVRRPRQAESALGLMLEDARAREAAGWDWATHGYGQVAFQLVQAAAAAGAPEVAEQLLSQREALHLTLNKDLVPTLIRKIVAAAADGDAAGGGDLDAQLDVADRLYEQEVVLRGCNSAEAAYELSRLLRRAEDVPGVRSLHGQMLREGLVLRERVLEDLQRWLAKRGVRV